MDRYPELSAKEKEQCALNFAAHKKRKQAEIVARKKAEAKKKREAELKQRPFADLAEKLKAA